MWFEDDDLLGRRLGFRHRKKKKHILQTNMRLDKIDKAAKKRFAIYVLLPFIVAATGAIIWFGVTKVKTWLFTGNDAFALKNIEITILPKENSVITPEFIRAQSGIEPGMNLFQVPLKSIRSEFLKDMHNIREMEIRRQLPDTLLIQVSEREPIARIGRTGGLVSDSDGLIFVKKSGLDQLPVIFGYSGDRLRPGDRLTGMTLAAIQVLEACADPRYDVVKVKSIDVSNEEYLVLWLNGGKYDYISWNEMGETTEIAMADLNKKLEQFAMALNSDIGLQHNNFDSRFEDTVYAEK